VFYILFPFVTDLVGPVDVESSSVSDKQQRQDEKRCVLVVVGLKVP
jgi:hypothetical protein